MISKAKGEFKLTPDAKAWYENWYDNVADKTEILNSKLIGYYDRKHVFLLKVAMMLSLADNDSLVLQQRDVEAALGVLEMVEPGMYKAFSAVGKNPNATVMQNIIAQIRKRGSMTAKELLAANLNDIPDRKTFDDLLMTLVLTGDIKLAGEAPKEGQPSGPARYSLV